MLNDTEIDKLVREARPRDFPMLRSYVRHGHSPVYVRRVMIPSLRVRHARIWTHVDSKPLTSEVTHANAIWEF
jgi:hypothetical protein